MVITIPAIPGKVREAPIHDITVKIIAKLTTSAKLAIKPNRRKKTTIQIATSKKPI
ncbi:hypothetical protein D9M69_653040 [compost metagenome]